MARASRKRDEQSILLKPADPFELVRLLARTQSDPRKAVAELVQNSLDAGARQVIVERVRQKGVLALVIRDDGEGVLPAMERREALNYIATNIGHSRKMGLDPSERARRVVAGKYGVGLLGFWSVGRVMMVRSRVAGSPLLELEMEEDTERASTRTLPLGTDTPDTFTEIVITPVHEVAQKALGGRRLSDYLASELRGQILSRKARVVVRDRIARGTAQKEFLVAPRRFSGERLALPDEIAVAGHPPIRVELYLARGAEHPAIQVACVGTVVADDIGELHALGLSGRPWIGCDLTGLVDFAAFNVPPGTRRGVAPDRAAAAFANALDEALRPLVTAELERLDAQRRAAIDRDVVRELQRALRGLRRKLPQYDLPKVPGSERGPSADKAENGRGRPITPPSESEPDGSEPLALFPVGPVATVRIVPEQLIVAAGAERRVSAVATDESGRRVQNAEFRWQLDAEAERALLSLRGEGARPAVVASPEARLGSSAALEVEAVDPRDSTRRATATARVVIGEVEPPGEALGVPEPRQVSDPDGRWRSRMIGECWEVNDAHPDYVALRTEPRARVRYLLGLLAKEIVIRTTGRMDIAEPLESLIEILAHAERNLRGS